MLTPRSASGASPRILLADDAAATRQLILTVLQNHGWPTDVAVNGQQAVDLFRQRPYDVVLTDMRMPVLDGVGLAKAIRAFEAEQARKPRALIIAVSGDAASDVDQPSEPVGIDCWIQKPIDLRALIATIDQHFRGGASPATTAPSPPPAADGPPVLDLPQALERLRGDKELLRQLAECFVEDQAELLAEIDSGVARGDVELVQRSAHTLKGASSNFGARRVVALAVEVERSAGEDFRDTPRLVSALKDEVRKLIDALGKIDLH